MGSVTAVCVVHQLRPDDGTIGATAIDKRPVFGPVRVRPLGLYADVQADRKHHGGATKAVYLYSELDAGFWSDELGRTLPPGWFGENLRVDGIDLTTARVGDRYAIGSVTLEITEPRFPCQTFARWAGGADARGWVKRFTAAARPGAYARVVKSGELQAGDAVVVTPAPDASAPTIAQLFAR